MEILFALFVIVFIVGMMLGAVTFSIRLTRALRRNADQEFKAEFRRRHLLEEEVLNDLNNKNEKW